MIKKIVAAICIAAMPCLFLSGCGTTDTDKQLKSIQKAGVIKVAVPKDYAPYSFLNEITGEYDGIDVQIGRDIASALNVSFEAVPIEDKNDLAAAVKKGFADIALGRIADDRELRYNNITSTSYDMGHIYAVTKKGDTKATLGAFEGDSVAASTKLSKSVKNNLNQISEISLQFYDEYDIIESGILDGSISGYVCYMKDMMELIKNEKLQAQVISNISNENYVAVVRKDSYGLLDIINNTLEDMIESNRISEITDMYM